MDAGAIPDEIHDKISVSVEQVRLLSFMNLNQNKLQGASKNIHEIFILPVGFHFSYLGTST